MTADAEVIQAAAGIPPPCSLQTVLDAAAEAPLPQAAGQAPEAPPFLAGKVFDRGREEWLRLSPGAVLRRVIVDGFSEFLRFPGGRQQPLRSNNAISALKRPDEVSTQVGQLLACGAVEDVTHSRFNPGEVCYTLGVLLAERHG